MMDRGYEVPAGIDVCGANWPSLLRKIETVPVMFAFATAISSNAFPSKLPVVT